MKLRQFQYVVEVVKNGMNVTAAADKLFTSQPGVSSQIKRLEEDHGKPTSLDGSVAATETGE